MQEQVTRFYRVKAVAEMFDVSRATIYRMVKSGELDAVPLAGAVRIPDYAIAALVEKGSEAARQAVSAGTFAVPEDNDDDTIGTFDVQGEVA